MKTVAVILSGCGVYDGSEIHEAVLTMLALAEQGAKYRCFAPNVEQYHVINHLTGEVSEAQTRNVLVESARIARGDISDVAELNVNDFDAVILPGGFGAAKNLCDFAIHDVKASVEPSVLKACLAFAHAHKPAGYMCIAPAMIALIYEQGSRATIGTDEAIAAQLTTMGLEHIRCTVADIVVDNQHKLVSTPAYMLAGSITEASRGIQKLVAAVLAMS